MKKTAIVTFHRACNYGAFLQAYALQNVLGGNGCDAHILDYDSRAIRDGYTMIGHLRSKGNILKKIAALMLSWPMMLARNRVFSQCRNKHFFAPEKELQKTDLDKISEQYDCFIAGSDQVWNREIIGRDDAFFLDFVKEAHKKYSYAASIGSSNLSAEELDDITERLRSFQVISLREPNALPLLRDRLGAERVQCNIDPVFLLGAERWRSFMQKPCRKPYVLYFTLLSNKQARPAMRFAKQLAEEKGAEALYLSNNSQWFRMRELKHLGVTGPEQFVGLIDEAEYVVTNSFHATAFCIILHKPFFVETNIFRSGRIVNLLKLCGLSDRALVNGVLPTQPVPIDWDAVDRKLAAEIQRAKDYLKKITES